MKTASRGFSLVDLVAVAAIIALVAAVGGPSLFRAGELSKRMTCRVNLKGIGAAAQVYAANNNGRWMIPGFRNGSIDNGGIRYVATGLNAIPELGEVGYQRVFERKSEDRSGVGGSISVTTTRAFWMLVRSGAARAQQFVCPSAADDSADTTGSVSLFYDFESYNKISYGYQVPFGPVETQPRDGADGRRIQAADKGPFYFLQVAPNWNVGPGGKPVLVDDLPRFWRAFNSPNHGGTGNGEGQNVLFADNSVSFVRTPAVGVDDDNIYTVMTDEWASFLGFNRIHGDPPQTAPTLGDPYPGQDAIRPGVNGFSSTDTLIYP